MNSRKYFKLKDIVIRMMLILIFGIIIWKFIMYLSDLLIGQEEYTPLGHFIIALITTILTILLVHVALKLDNLSWKQLGQATFKTNLFAFLLGLLLWTIPAAIGLFICLAFGWVEVDLQSDWLYLLMSISLLFITVFLMEALPEEIIFRGYMYRFLHVLFPHWGVIILQALLFSIFAYLIGAMYSIEQLQFLPGFAIILGIFRAISGNVWTSIGFHVAIMTVTQILSPIHGHFDVSGLSTLRFFAFILLPSIIGATVLSFIYSHFKWNKKEPLH